SIGVTPFAAQHGSWNRSKRAGYKVIRVLLDHGIPTGKYEDFMTGFVVNDVSVWARLVGIAVTPRWRPARQRRCQRDLARVIPRRIGPHSPSVPMRPMRSGWPTGRPSAMVLAIGGCWSRFGACIRPNSFDSAWCRRWSKRSGFGEQEGAGWSFRFTTTIPSRE